MNDDHTDARNGEGIEATDEPLFEETETDLGDAEVPSPQAAPEPLTEVESPRDEAAIRSSLVTLGFVSFDDSGSDNTTSGVMVSPELRGNFRRDVYVGIRDADQGKEFLGRVVEGPFHNPHELSSDSAISRTTLLYPERTKFRPTYYAHGIVEVLGEIRDGERVVPSATRPRPYAETYMFPSERLRKMLGLEGDFFLGHLMGYEDVPVFADVAQKGFLPRNVGVFGTIGSGKSNTTQVLMEEALRAGWAVVVVDVEGEYVRMSEPTTDEALLVVLAEDFQTEARGVGDLQVYVPSSGASDAETPISFKVPVSQVQPEILADIMELSEPQQRMWGTIAAAAQRQGSRSGAGASRMGVLAGSQSRSSTRPYTLQTLIDGLDEDGNYPLLGRAPTGPEKTTASVLRSKLINLGRSGMLDWTVTQTVPELPILELLRPGGLSVLDVSETDDRSRNIAISFLLQELFGAVLETDRGAKMPNGVERPPVLVVIEEVHTFVSRATVARMRSVVDQLQIISRRGRKRWMGLVLVSQQPGHVPDELFELANTRFIHQLRSVSNLTPVRQTTGGVHEALWGTVPALGPGQCLLTGSIFRNPVFINMRPARSRRLLVT